MAEYINIRGQSIEVVASDPANPTIGQIWYNSTSNTLKGGGVTTAGAWATGNNMNTARTYLAGAGTQTAALGFGGYKLVLVLLQEQQKNMMEQLGQMVVILLNTARYEFSRLWNSNSRFSFGGILLLAAATEEYDGNAWTT
jgi:hypothetical protein